MANANFFSPDGGITRYPLEDTEGRITYEEEIHGVNLLHPTNLSITTYGSTITYNVDGTILKRGTVSGGNAQYVFAVPTNADYAFPAELEAGKEYILSGCPTGGADGTYEIYIQFRNADNTAWGAIYHDYGEGVRFTATGTRFGVYVRIFNGNTDTLVFEPMITEAKYAGIPYRPYNQQSIQNQLNAQTGVLGAKKLLPFPYIDGTQAIDGVTFTVNNNTEIVTANGTPDSGKYPAFKLASASFLNSLVAKYGPVIVSGCPAGGGNSTYQLFTRSASMGYLYERGDELYLDCTDLNDYLYIQIREGYTVSNVVFDPSIRLASDPDRSHSLYAMTNRELTEAAGVWTSAVSCLVGDTSKTISDSSITTSSIIKPYSQTSSGIPVAYKKIVVSSGSATITFTSALTEAASIKLQIL